MRTGGTYALVNRGGDSYDVDDNAAGSLGTLTANQGAIIGLVDNSTQAGVWAFMSQPVGFVDNPALTVLGYVFGGDTSAPSGDQEDALEFNPQLDTWTAKTDAPTDHVNGTTFVIGVAGYITGDESPISDANEEYDPDTWTTRTAITATTRRASACALNDGVSNKGYVFEGATPSLVDTTYVYTAPPTDSWATTTDQTDGSQYASACNINDFGHVLGGNAHGGSTIDNHYQLDVTGADTWSSKTVIIHGRMFFSMTGLGNDGYVFGGATSDATTQASCWDETNIYSQTGDSWSFGTDLPHGKVCESAVFVLSSIHYLCGGDSYATGSSVREDATYSYDSTTDAWTAETDMTDARSSIHNQGQGIQA
jgi:N-acetylneuraminic acid mutarotase